jgi:hypothetical protein
LGLQGKRNEQEGEPGKHHFFESSNRAMR